MAELATTVRQLLEPRWPFAQELSEIARYNLRRNLKGVDAFSDTLRPVFFVGDLEGDPEFLFIGLKPGLNKPTTHGFADEVSAISADFESYWESRLAYFTSNGLNRRHYGPVARLTAGVLDAAPPADVGTWLHRHVVQVELVPYFRASTSGLSDADWMDVRSETAGGRLASQVLDRLLQGRRWAGIVVRYAQTGRLFSLVTTGASHLPAKVPTGDGREIPVVQLTGQRLSNAYLDSVAGSLKAAIEGAVRTPPPAKPQAERTKPASPLPAGEWIPEVELGLRNRNGRRWAVAQSFAYGGAPESIIERAHRFYEARCSELGTTGSVDVTVDLALLQRPDNFYTNLLESHGWDVHFDSGEWHVSRTA